MESLVVGLWVSLAHYLFGFCSCKVFKFLVARPVLRSSPSRRLRTSDNLVIGDLTDNNFFNDGCELNKVIATYLSCPEYPYRKYIPSFLTHKLHMRDERVIVMNKLHLLSRSIVPSVDRWAVNFILI